MLDAALPANQVRQLDATMFLVLEHRVIDFVKAHIGLDEISVAASGIVDHGPSLSYLRIAGVSFSMQVADLIDNLTTFVGSFVVAFILSPKLAGVMLACEFRQAYMIPGSAFIRRALRPERRRGFRTILGTVHATCPFLS